MIINIFERHRQNPSYRVNRRVTKELEAKTGSEVVALLPTCTTLEDDMRSESPVEVAGSPSTSMDRTRNEFPERFEFLKHGGVRVEVVRSGVVQIRGNPYCVANSSSLHRCA